MATKSERNHKKGERDVGRLMLQEGFVAWRTSQNRQSNLDSESDDVSSNMVPEHMRVNKHGQEDRNGLYIDMHYVFPSQGIGPGNKIKAIDSFDKIPNLTIEVKNGYYDCKTYHKQFKGWVDKLERETPTGNFPVLFWRRDYSGRFEYRLSFCLPCGARVITTTGEETRKVLPVIQKRAKALASTGDDLTLA